MFERRLTILLVLVAATFTLLTGRLFQLQVLHGGHYRELAESALESPAEMLWPVRARILDRNGRVLASDEPTYDATIHYGILSMSRDYLAALERRIRREQPPTTLPREGGADGSREAVRQQIVEMWSRLARASGVPLSELRRRRDEISRRVEALRQYLWKARIAQGYGESLEDLRIVEETSRHAILTDLSADVRARIELEVGDLVRVEPSVRRVASSDPAVCHLVGRMGEVTTEQMEHDAFRDDELRRYRPGERAGVSGVERLAEPLLRGVRGLHQVDMDGRVLVHVPPQRMPDVRITIDMELQERIVDILGRAVAEHPPSTGGACVVLDVRSREILALVSYPVFDPSRYDESYEALRDDTRPRPLLFRAVAEEYPPGSIVKPWTLLCGLSSGIVKPEDRVECRGRLFENTDAWYCWTQWRHAAPHGLLNAVEALQHSCNVYFYTLGQRVGGERLTQFYRLVFSARGPGGASSRTDLVEERDGFVPDETWLRAHRGHGFRTGDARNYAIGQGEVQITPLQAANLFATIAAGEYRAPTLLAGGSSAAPAQPLAMIRAADWAVVREGLYRCANEPGGTAYPGAHRDDVIVCGKTGSAECVPRITEWLWTFTLGNGETKQVRAPTVEAARRQLGLDAACQPTGRKPAARWPVVELGRGKHPTHAWFAGYAPREDPRIAVAVVVEYAGSGGRVAAPVAQEILGVLLDSPHGYLTRDAAFDAASRARRDSPLQPEDTD